MSKISIIMPIYNVEKYLKQCLDSIINQTLSDIEIICVDDCSQDNSLDILKEYAQNDNRIKIITQDKNGGQGKSRNAGIDAATSDYIMFIDPDDWFTPDACETAYNQITSNNNDYAYFNYYSYYEEDEKIEFNDKKYVTLLEQENPDNIDPAKLTKPFKCSSECWHNIYKTSFIKKYDIKFSTDKSFEDFVFHFRSLTFAKSISVINKPLYYYRKRKNSSVRTVDYLKGCPRAWMNVLESIPKSASQVQQDSIALNCIGSLLFWYKQYRLINPAGIEEFYNSMHQIFVKINNKTFLKICNQVNCINFYIIKVCKTYKNYEFIMKTRKQLDKIYEKFRKLIKIEKS